MKISILDFESVLKNYLPYHESLKKIQSNKQEFSDKIDQIKTEMERIVKSSQSLILDDNTKVKNANRFKELQSQGISLEAEFRNNISELQNNELDKNFKEIQDIASEYSTLNGYDIVLNKSQVVFLKEEFDITNDIISLVKEKGFFVDENHFQVQDL